MAASLGCCGAALNFPGECASIPCNLTKNPRESCLLGLACVYDVADLVKTSVLAWHPAERVLFRGSARVLKPQTHNPSSNIALR